jgi:hypothetical protein
MENLELFKNRNWQRQRNDKAAYLEDINPVIAKVNEIVTYANASALVVNVADGLKADGLLTKTSILIEVYP